MDSAAHTGFGAKLQRGDGQSPETFVDVVGIKSITGPNITRDTHDVTTQNQTDNFKEFIGGLNDGGQIQFQGNWLPRDPTQSQEDGGWLGEFDKTSCESRRNWRIVAPECPGEAEVYLQVKAIVTGADIQIPMDNVMAFNGTMKVSGRPELVIVSG